MPDDLIATTNDLGLQPDDIVVSRDTPIKEYNP
jgi:hypothetical protein